MIDKKLNKIYMETKECLDLMVLSGSSVDPSVFIDKYNELCRKTVLHAKFRQVICNWWVKKKFIELYNDVIFIC